MHIDHVRVAFTEHPGVMCENYSRNQVNEVVTAQGNHQSDLANACDQRETRKPIPADGAELKEVDDAAAHMTREKEVVSLAIGHCDRVKTWELPKIAFRILEIEELL